MTEITIRHVVSRGPWIGVDLDGTLARYDGWRGVDHVGDPIPDMLARVRRWLDEGREVKILTARAAPRADGSHVRAAEVIRGWCLRHVGQALEITCVKDGHMIELWDDRAVTVEENTGRQLSRSRRELDQAPIQPIEPHRPSASDCAVAHDWRPVRGNMGQYFCSRCPATGYRRSGTRGAIAPHRYPRDYAREPTAAPTGAPTVAVRDREAERSAVTQAPRNWRRGDDR